MNNTGNKDISIFERHPRMTIVCFCLVSIFILDFLSANIYRFLNGYLWNDRKYASQQKLEKTYRIPSKFYHHGLATKKAIHGISWGPNIYDYYTNSLGFKDKSNRDIPLASNKHRIVFIGDSFTEGVGIDYEQTFVGLIDETLSKKKVEVLNAGVKSYSPIIYWKKVRYLIENIGLKFDQLVVFLDIGDAQDEAIYYCLDESGNVKYNARKLEQSNCKLVKDENENYYGILLNRFKTSIDNNSILTRTVLQKIYHIIYTKEKAVPQVALPFLADKNNSQYKYSRAAWTIDNKLYQEYGKQGLGEMKFYMDKLNDMLKKNDIKLTVAVYPWPIQIAADDLNSIQATFWSDWCRRRGVNFINYFPYFVTGKSKEDRMQIINKYYTKNDVHFNKAGHRLIADVFLADYDRQK